jgi:ADP-heptose:LPS heptosyltransferase
LRRGFPAARITLVCGSWNEALARRLGWFEHIVCFDFFTPLNRDWLAASIEIQSRYEAVRALALETYDLAVDLRHDADTRPCLYRVHARYRAGFAAPLEIGLPHLDLMLPHSEGMAAGEAPPLSLHSEFRLQLLAQAVVSTFNAAEAHPAMKLVPPGPPPETRRFAVFAIGAGDPIRVWPIERYAELGNALVIEHGLDIIVLGGAAEAEDAARLVSALPKDAARSVIGMPIVDLPGLLAAAALCVCNGSGISHLAAGLGVPTVTILGGTTRMEVWRPEGPRAVAVGGKTPCQPCGLRRSEDCEWDVACLKIIRPALVLAACEKLLALEPTPVTSHPR